MRRSGGTLRTNSATPEAVCKHSLSRASRTGPFANQTQRRSDHLESRAGKLRILYPRHQSPPSNCPRRSSHGAPPGQSRSPGSAVPSGPGSSLSAGMASRVRAGLPHARTPRARVPLHP
ncbi:PREDICTED: uncharacterized protein LOC105522137 [Colobus angolensis palliatus]|uniref:uncharacterized protein LOC105522137 n=1 Tax=Colobus angolensis palliatus TaxID=336983 RepID=UPI0005F498EA|nr:PREDICTED: uncharacterized protein LOC105522137 [Colobus angolensis palliatus]